MAGAVPPSSTAAPAEAQGVKPRDEPRAPDALPPETLPPETLRLVAEAADVSKRKVVTGRVDVRTVTDTADEIVRSTVEGQTVDVTRVPIDRYVDTAPAVRTEGDVTIVPVLEEVLVIEKRLLLKEEVHIRRTTRSEDIETTVALRRQRAVVERHDAGAIPKATNPNSEDIPT